MSYYNLPKFKAFRFWCQKVLPLVYDDSLSYYEVLSKVVHGLNLQADAINEIEDILEGSGIDIDEAVEKVIEKLEEDGVIETEVANAIAQAISDGDIDERCEYVVNQMVSDGDLDTYVDGQISDYITGGSADNYIEGLISAETANKIKQYDTFADIPTSGLSVGEIIRTKGYYQVSDDGSAFYQVKALESNYYPVNAGYSFKIVDEVTPAKCGARAASGYDDSGIFNNLLNVYSKVNLKSKTYYVNASIVIPKSNVHITSDKATIKRMDYNSNPAIVSAQNGTITIENIIFDGGVQEVTSTLVSLISGATIRVCGCVFQNVYGYALRFSGNVRSIVEKCFFRDITGAQGNPGGAIYQQGGHDVIYKELNGTNMQDHLVYLDGSVNTYRIIIDNCKVWDNDRESALTNGAVIAIYGNASDVSISNIEASNVKSGVIISKRNNITPNNITITNCSFSEYDEEGVIVDGTGNPVKLNVSNCNFINSGQDGISIRNATVVTISNCTFEGITRDGLQSTGSANISTTGCIFRNCAVGILHGSDDNTSNVVICGCMFINGTYGLYLRAGAYATVSGILFLGTFSSAPCAITMTNVVADNIPLDSSQGRSIFWASSVPTVGYHHVGEICLDSTGATKGWKCTVTGGPGTWVAIE